MSLINLYIVTFDNDSSAQKLLEDIEDTTQQGVFDFIDAAVLIHRVDGHIEISETSDPSTNRGAVVGGIVGGVIGLIGGPVGAGLGAAAGAAIGGFATSRMDLGIPDDDLKSIAESLPPRTSALLIVIKDAWVDNLFTKCSEYECEIKEQELSEEVIAELMDESN